MFQKTMVTLLVGLLLVLIGTIASGNGFLITAAERTYVDGNITANINDHKVFNVREITTSDPQAIPKASNYNAIPLDSDFRENLQRYNSVSFLVVKDGEVVSENYFGDYHDHSKTNSFSMAKTVTTLLLGIAIEDGLIAGLDQRLSDFLPEFLDDPLGKHATIGQLSLMNSGYEWVEHYYSPFSPTVQLLYGPDVSEFLLARDFSAKPGEFWEYASASTQLLGIILDRALKQNNAAGSVAEYLSKRIWQPMQMNDNALWHTDDAGMELVFCCINTNARNFARLGMLMLNQGRWNGQQLVPAEFVRKMITPIGQPYYGYSTWLNQEANPAFYWFSGHLGQYIIVIPEHNMVIVRLGETRESDYDYATTDLPLYIDQAFKLSGLN